MKNFSKINLGFYTILILSLLTLVGCGSTTSQATKSQENSQSDKPIELTISTAPSLKSAFSEIQKNYQAKNPNIKLTFNYGPSGSLQNQIEQGAAIDIFVSQGKDQMDALEQKGLLKKDSRINLLTDELVLIVPKSNTSINHFSDLANPKIEKIGIGEAQSVPAAKTAQETLQTLKLWDPLQSKFVRGKDLNQILVWVESGNVNAGFVWDTIAKTSEKVRVAERAPANSHQPVSIPAAIVGSTKNGDAANQFLQYLKSDEAMRVFEKYGFKKP